MANSVNVREFILDRINQEIESCETNIADIKAKLEKDYLYHFAWMADELFKYQWEKKAFQEFKEVFEDSEDMSLEELAEGFARRATSMRGQILSDLIPSSTSMMHNVATMLTNECRKDVAEKLDTYARLIKAFLNKENAK